jgi:restriction endonuclease S subunit
LEGLEIKEVMISDPINTDLIRLEPEFYTAKSFLLTKSYIGSEIIEFVQYGTSEELNEDNEGFPILRLNEFQSSFIGVPSKSCNIIDKPTFESLKLKKNDVLICRTNGNPRLVGKSAIVPNDYEFAYASYLFKIRPKSEMINSSTLVTFLNSKYGRLEIEKFSMASNQVNFSPAKFREMRIPNFGFLVNNRIEEITYNAFDLLNKSQKLYSQAETLLLETLGLKDFEANQEAVNIKGYKESFLSTGRLDAEYYQKKYEEIIEHVRSGKYDKLGNLVTMRKSIEPGSEAYQAEGIPFIRVSNLTKYGLSEPDIHLNTLEYADVIRPKKDTILMSKDGTVGVAYKVPDDMFAITSGAILHLQVKTDEVLPDYLTLVLNSLVVQMQAERDAGGSILQHWKPSEIEQVEIPVVDKDVQHQISELIQESFRLKKESEQLLDLAKRAVEVAIEEGEEKAMEMIESINVTVN